ncbi:MAG TPA: hypothetical protein VFV08_11600 [Puia sp.]|nr:hypothetical protein [Puia sp.]
MKKIQENTEIKKVDLALKHNRRILRELFDSKKQEVLIKREILLKKGFDFDYHTHIVLTKTYKNEFIFCYDYGYREAEKGKFRIIKSF